MTTELTLLTEGAQTLWGTSLYLGARVLYVPLYAFGIPYVRTLV
jgi:uncharacterized MAPEG superfamily protein